MTKLFFRTNRILSAVLIKSKYSTAPKSVSTVRLNNKEFIADDYTNVTPKIISYLNKNLHLQKGNPLSLVKQCIVDYFYSNFTHRGHPSFSVYDNLSPIVTVKQNFDDLLIPLDHPSRVKTDCYYVNRNMLLRAHMTAHQSELLRSGLDNFLMIGDVYRRDEIDSTHFPVFHQVDAVRSQRKEQLFSEDSQLEIFEPTFDPKNPLKFTISISDPMKQSCHTLEATKLMEAQLKSHLIGLVHALFGKNIKHRWVEAYFPFTHPSWELEIFYEDNWMEVLGCGIVRNEILANAGPNNAIAYAFGLGLERLAMALYKIPDIRLMWSTDSGFLTQFQNKSPSERITYKPVSQYPQCRNDISFWLPSNMTIESFTSNDFYDLVRDIGGDIIEQVKLKDKFVHPKTKQHSMCYTIVYRHLERTLTQAQVNQVHQDIEKAAAESLNVVDAVRSQRKEQLFSEDSQLEIFEPTFDPKNPLKFTISISDPMKQSCHTLEATKLMEAQLKSHLIGLVHALFGKNIKHRWVEAYFPFTHPSWELEIFYEDNWMEVLGCGIVRNEILANAGPNNAIAYAFGLGLERLAMALYKIPDIRLMWSTDSGFLTQFQNKSPSERITYKPVSQYPQCRNDISFWLPSNMTIESFTSNDFYDLVRDIGGDIIEQVKLKDKFVHPKTKQHSMCYTIVYRHLERTLTQAQVNQVHQDIEKAAAESLNVVIR